jgi:hypothetical protein
MDEEERFTMDEAHVKFAKSMHSEVWTLLEKALRSPEESERMKYAAYASCYHWLYAGNETNHQRGEWLIARVHLALNESEAALQHARRCLELTLKYAELMEDFDLPFAYECMARAEGLAGHVEDAASFYRMAKETGEKIKDEEDKKIFFEELNKDVP